jgi:hypothetical protein
MEIGHYTPNELHTPCYSTNSWDFASYNKETSVVPDLGIDFPRAPQ